jgi:Tfp pilus assembly protein PilO
MGSSDGREDFHMSTTLIVVIVVAAVILLALLALLLPRMRDRAHQRKAERELQSRRSAAAEEHRGIAAERESRAEIAEQQARMAEQAAQRERAEANLQAERAEMHERGMADRELIDESERDKFEGVAERDERRFDRDRITDDVRESERPRR